MKTLLKTSVLAVIFAAYVTGAGASAQVLGSNQIFSNIPQASVVGFNGFNGFSGFNGFNRHPNRFRFRSNNFGQHPNRFGNRFGNFHGHPGQFGNHFNGGQRLGHPNHGFRTRGGHPQYFGNRRFGF